MSKYKPTRKEVINRRNKGKSLERQVAALIVKAFQDSDYEDFQKADDDDAKRLPMSGALKTLPKYKFYGDIVKSGVIKEAFPFCVECKNQKGFPSLESLLTKRLSVFQKSWQQCVDAAIEAQEIPLLVWRRKQGDPILCAIPKKLCKEVSDFDLWAEGEIFVYDFKKFLWFILPFCEQYLRTKTFYYKIKNKEITVMKLKAIEDE